MKRNLTLLGTVGECDVQIGERNITCETAHKSARSNHPKIVMPIRTRAPMILQFMPGLDRITPGNAAEIAFVIDVEDGACAALVAKIEGDATIHYRPIDVQHIGQSSR